MSAAQRSPWHVGVLVADLDKAVAELGVSIGTTFTPPAVVRFEHVEDPDPRAVDIRVAFSRGAVPQLELIEGPPGEGIYSLATYGPGLHHLGYWEDDIDRRFPERVRAGSTCVAKVVGPDGGLVAWYGTTAASPGVLAEYIDAGARLAIEAFVATGDVSHLG